MSSKEQTHSNNKASSKQRSLKPTSEDSNIQMQQQAHPTPIVQRAKLDLSSLSPHDMVQLQHTIGNQAVGQLLAGRMKSAAPSYAQEGAISPMVSVVGFSNKLIQRELDEELKGELEMLGYTGPVNGQYMVREGENMSNEDVNWKAHIGVEAKDRRAVIEKAGPIFSKYKIEHKFDVNQADQLPKFVTIYPPINEAQWAPLLTELDNALSGIDTKIENSTKAVMGGGKVSMRHGQITALTADKIKEAGIEITPGAKEAHAKGTIQYYNITNKRKVWQGQAGTLAWVDFMGAFFFMTPKGPQAAVIWNGQLRADPREKWNPFDIDLPPGVKTTQDIHEILKSQEEMLKKIELLIKDCEARVNYFYETEEKTISISDKREIDARNAKIGREYDRLRKLLQKVNDSEQALLRITSTAIEERLAKALEKVAELKKFINTLFRRLDVVF